MTLPRSLKEAAAEAAAALEWSVGDWILAAAAEEGPRLRERIGIVGARRRPRVDDAAFTAIYLTPEERQELDDQAVACGLSRSAFVTAVGQLALGHELEDVVVQLRGVPRDG